MINSFLAVIAVHRSARTAIPTPVDATWGSSHRSPCYAVCEAAADPPLPAVTMTTISLTIRRISGLW